MGPSTRTLLAGALAALLACSPPPKRPDPIPRGDYSYAIEYLEWRIEHLMADEDLPGLAIALVDDQEVVWQHAWGVTRVSGGEDVTVDTVWRVGSITKLVTAIEVMRLEEEGLVDLDAPITEYLPDFEVQSYEADPEPITLREMLAHRAGLPRNSGLPSWYWDPQGEVLQAQAAELALFHAAHPVGYRYHYSNAAFNVMAALIEREREAFWPDYARDAFLEPLGMNDSALLLEWLPEDAVVAVGHEGGEDRTDPIEQGDIIEMGSGNLYSSMRDMATFVTFVLGEGEPLLDPETLWSMYEVQYDRPRDPKQMGLAWFTTDTRFPELMVHHTGTNQGTETMLALLPESKLGVVVASNSTRFADLYGALVVEALDILLETKTGTKTPPLEDAKKHALDPDDLDPFEGTYVCDDDPVEVFRKGGKLKLRYGSATFHLVPIGRSRFRVEHWLGDPGHLEVSFFVDDPADEDLMIIAIEEMEHVYCPRYPDVTSIPALWEEIAGRYRVVPRVESVYFEGDSFGTVEASIEEDERLRLGRFLIWPQDAAHLRIVGGEWNGETIARDPETGEMIFQYELDIPLGR